MSFSNLIKIFDKHEEHYNLFTIIIRDLQPIAFLISASLVIAVFFFNRDTDSISGKYAVFASLSFFFAYLGFAFYKITNYSLSFYWGFSLTLLGVSLIYKSFGGAFDIILSDENKIITTLAFSVICSIYILLTKFMLAISNKNNLRYKISNTLFYIAVLLILIILIYILIGYVLIGIYFELTIILMFFTILILTLIAAISCTNIKKIKNRRREDKQEDFSYQ